MTARVKTQTKVLAICDEKAGPAATGLLATATKPDAIVDPTALRHTLPVPVPINHIRPAHPPRRQTKKKATPSRTPPFDLSC